MKNQQKIESRDKAGLSLEKLNTREKPAFKLNICTVPHEACDMKNDSRLVIRLSVRHNYANGEQLHF